MRKLLDGCMDLYFDLITDPYFPYELTEPHYGLIMDIKKKLDSCYYVCKTGYVIKYDPGQPRDDRGRWTESGGSSGGSSGSAVAGDTDTASNAHPRNEEFEKLIKRCIDAPEPVFAYDLKRNFKKIPKEQGKYHTAMHGDSDSVYLFGTKVDETILFNILKSRKDYHGEEIVLISCNTGNSSSKKCFAQKLADKSGKRVHAPSKYGAISATGEYYSSDITGKIRLGAFDVFDPKPK